MDIQKVKQNSDCLGTLWLHHTIKTFKAFNSILPMCDDMQTLFFCNKERRTRCWVSRLTTNLLFAPYFTLKSHQGKFSKISLCHRPMILLSPFICADLGWKLHWLHQSETELWLHGYGNTAGLLFHISLTFILHNSGEHCFGIAFFSPDLFFQNVSCKIHFLCLKALWGGTALSSFLSNVFETVGWEGGT